MTQPTIPARIAALMKAIDAAESELRALKSETTGKTFEHLDDALGYFDVSECLSELDEAHYDAETFDENGGRDEPDDDDYSSLREIHADLADYHRRIL